MMTATIVKLHAEGTQEGLPAIIDRARTTLAEARTSAEAFEARKIGEMALHLAKLQKAGLAVEADCILLVAQAERKIGEELRKARENGELANNKGAPTGGRGNQYGTVPDSNRTTTLADLGITKKQSAAFQDLARASEETIVNAVQAEVAAGKSPTKAAIRRAVKPKQPPATKPSKPVTEQRQKAFDAYDRQKAAGEEPSWKSVADEAGLHSGSPAVRAVFAAREAAEPQPLPELSMTAQQKLEVWQRKLEAEFDWRVREASQKWLNETRIPIYEKKVADLVKMLNWPRNSVMTKAEYKKIVMCLHPDSLNSRTKEQLEEAFRIFTHYKPKMVSDEEETRKVLNDLPKTREEMLARKRKK